ncbi:EAL domain-containing protein [Paraburkholderia sp.]|uniref:putative bifunctional diguanylate cyclase/phosphodiesterase n=1 Tax=Paraburkholderia sp. TaxID=1926495 RepID=UPI0023A0E1FB|nr:EAL domain-containing protein [Paraburkholderia sp.]MDE1182480.1 EAL domain-containing protein [Paraburkholderia sp.]
MPSPIRFLPRVDPSSAELNQSQFDAFSRQIPLLYFILVVNSAAVAFTHRAVAPAWLAIYMPLALCAAAVVRVIVWVGRRRVALDAAQIVARLRASIAALVVLGVSFTAWGLALYPYGDAYAQSHVAFYMSITVIGCIFCLMQMRTAALLLTAIVIVPFATFFMTTGNPVFIAISINVLLVSGAMISILLTYSRDFSNLVASQRALLNKQAEMQTLSDENSRLANIDSLTLLPNRRRFFSDIDNVLSQCIRENRGFAVGVLDLDGFKQLNDLYGHGFGDGILERTAHRLAALSNSQVSFARLGGDEFGVIVNGFESRDHLLEIGGVVCDVLKKPHVRPGSTTRLTGSLGFAIFPDAGETPEQLFERADYALYFAKENRRGAPVVFSTEHETEIRQVSAVVQALRDADLAREMTLVYQPIVDVAANRIVSFEALARWSSPSLGDVAPSVFIGIAERSELIHRITEVLLRQALAFARYCPPDIGISFNLSTRDLAADDALSAIIALTRSSGVEPGRIEFEVTETALINDFDQAAKALESLKALGTRISLDDFGTGFSSLSCVHRLPVDKLKIDRSFIAEITSRSPGRDIVKSINDLCTNLGLDCVMEGVETQAQLDVLKGLGCTLMQGYYFSKPVSAADVATVLARFDGTREAVWV